MSASSTAPARSVLIVEDDDLLRMALRDGLEAKGIRVFVAGSLAEACAKFNANDVDVVLLDEQLPDGRGHTVCERLLAERAQTKIIFMTAFPEFDHAVRALRAGAYDYLAKPFQMEAVHLAIERCFDVQELERMGRREQARRGREAQDVLLVGNSPAFCQLRELVERAASSTAPVLVTGETGTGKSLVARAIHAAGARREQAFVSLSCAALPDNLVEAELFGWERGSFTGAVAARDGAFELADRGTLFLDEVGEMPLHLQPKLLAALEERAIRRIGGRAARPVDTRIVTATNADLERLIADKSFRADLYYRLNVLHIHVPPLRERREDIPALALHLLSRISGCRERPTLDDQELERLASYDWPGNVRELRNVLDRAALLQSHDLRPSEMIRPNSSELATYTPSPDIGLATTEIFPTLDEVERRHIEDGLRRSGGNLALASRLLGISLSTLKRRTKERGSI